MRLAPDEQAWLDVYRHDLVERYPARRIAPGSETIEAAAALLLEGQKPAMSLGVGPLCLRPQVNCENWPNALGFP